VGGSFVKGIDQNFPYFYQAINMQRKRAIKPRKGE